MEKDLRQRVDFSAIGVHIKKEAPVSNFEPMVREVRRQRIPVALLDAKCAEGWI